MKYLFIVLVTIALGACGEVEEVEDNGGSNVNGFGEPSSGTVIETNYSTCGSGASSGVSIVSNKWFIQTRNSEGMREFTEMFVTLQGRAYFSKLCVLNGRTLGVNGDVPATFTNSMDGTKGVLEFHDHLNKSEQINEENFKMTCGLKVTNDSMNYSFYGRCLELSRPGKTQKMWMIPR